MVSGNTQKHSAPRPKTDEADASADLPYPDSDLPPVLQRVIRRKIEEGEDEGPTETNWNEALRKAARMSPPDSER